VLAKDSTENATLQFICSKNITCVVKILHNMFLIFYTPT